MAVVTGNIYTVEAGPTKTSAGQITVQLCGYGSQVPRINGMGLFAGVESIPLPIDPTTGVFTAALWGNDIIVPAGTYYVFTFADVNGDIVQVNAYRFLDSVGTYDLNLIDPYDPNQPPPPLPPIITNLLLLIAYSPTPDFPGDVYTAWGLTLTGDVIASSTSDVVIGNLYTFIIRQDGTGGWDFQWPPNVINATPINPAPNSITVQTFVAVGPNGPLLPIGAGTWWNQ